MNRAVQRGLARRHLTLPTALGVNETSFQKRHEYVTVVCNTSDGSVLHVADGRSEGALTAFYRQCLALAPKGSEGHLPEFHAPPAVQG